MDLSVDEYLSGFQILAIVNKKSMLLLQKTAVWSFFKKLKIDLSYEPVI